MKQWGLVLLAISMIWAAGGCSKKGQVRPDGDGSSVEDGSVDSGDIGGLGSSDDGTAMGLVTIFFPYDSSDIVGEGREALKNNIRVMKENSSLKVQIEGHCDQRGGIQYNLALGERRANAVKQAMLAGGIGRDRVATISLGKEKPLDNGNNEAAWGRNRRANFSITEK